MPKKPEDGMHLKWRRSEVVHGAMPGANKTLCGKSTRGAEMVLLEVTCFICLEQAKHNAEAIANILGRLK